MTRPVVVIQHVPHEDLGLIAGVLQRGAIDYEYVQMHEIASHDFQPATASALVVMGGPMNVDQTSEHPGLLTEIDWIRAAIAADLPVLGICLGSQLMAAALGANVYAANTKEIGWYSVQMTDAASNDPVFGACRGEEMVFQWHGCTFDLPIGAVRLASSELFVNQAFRYGRAAYGLQFHLETTAEMIDTWLSEPSNWAELSDLEYIEPDQVRRETLERLPAALELGKQLFGRFAEICGRSQ